MKKRNWIIAGAAAAIAGAAVYFFRKKRSADPSGQSENHGPAKKHRTNVFARAKDHAKGAPQ